MWKKAITGEASLAKEITDVMRDRIINGEYAMGEKLIENKLAEELKVSRTPVRDAFRQLAKEQLVDYVPNKGCFAKGFSNKDMEDIYAVRKAVEQLAITWAIENADDRQLLELSQQLELMSFYTENNSYARLLEANEEFHNMIYQMTGSRFIVQILKTYQDYVHIARKSTLKKEEDLPAIYREHEAIYKAIADRNVAEAEAAVGIHMDNTAGRARERWIENNEQKQQPEKS
ncbi:MAG: GntR family transcriptional regulator [Anaerovoracaceae bacterium]|nr:GntR family transcriptional regulator [Anaerovoracaceae bacterium]